MSLKNKKSVKKITKSNVTKIVTHSGKFHPDDVSAVAILSLYLNKPIKIFRSRDPKVWAKADYLIDVGEEYSPKENKFDHHQEGFNMKRVNGIKYSSSGLMWKHFGEKIAGSHDIWKKIDEEIIQPFDADDNGIELFKNNFEGIAPYCFTDYIYSFNLTPIEKNESSLRAFKKAVEVTKKIIEREIKRAKDKILSAKPVKDIYEKTADKRIIVLDGNYSAGDVLMNYPEPLFVIRPSSDTGTWVISTINIPNSKFTSRLLFPKSWAGKFGSDLAKITGVSDALFCHNLRFIAGAKSKEGAIALAKLAINSKS